jgi:hypothetical protein
MNLRPGWASLAIVAGAALTLVVIAAALGRCRLPAKSDLRQSSWSQRALLLIPLAGAGYGLVVVAVEALRMPLIQTDAWEFWLFKAKIIANEQLNPPPLFFTAPSYAYTHVHYPLLWPMLAAVASGSIAAWDEQTARLILIPLYAAFGLMIYATLSPRLGRFAAAMIASIQLALPNVLYYAGWGIADVILTGFYAAMLGCLLLHAEQNDLPTMIAAALLAAACVFTKIEGAPLAAIGALMLFFSSCPALARGHRPESALFGNRDGATGPMVCVEPRLCPPGRRLSVATFSGGRARQLEPSWADTHELRPRIPVVGRLGPLLDHVADLRRPGLPWLRVWAYSRSLAGTAFAVCGLRLGLPHRPRRSDVATAAFVRSTRDSDDTGGDPADGVSLARYGGRGDRGAAYN